MEDTEHVCVSVCFPSLQSGWVQGSRGGETLWLTGVCRQSYRHEGQGALMGPGINV